MYYRGELFPTAGSRQACVGRVLVSWCAAEFVYCSVLSCSTAAARDRWGRRVIAASPFLATATTVRNIDRQLQGLGILRVWHNPALSSPAGGGLEFHLACFPWRQVTCVSTPLAFASTPLP